MKRWLFGCDFSSRRRFAMMIGMCCPVARAWWLALLGLLLLALCSCAGPRRLGNRGWGPEDEYQALFDKRSLDSVSGKVVLVERIFPMRGMSWGVEIQVQAPEETVAVHLGPVWYLKRQELQVREGDRVVVRGSRIRYQGGQALLATELSKGPATLLLRDARGQPLWSGVRRR